MWLCSKGMKAVLKPDYYFNISISSSSKIQKGAITRLHTCTESHCEWIGRKLGRNTAEWAGRCQCWVIPLWFPSTWWMCVSSAGLCQHGVFHNWFFTGVRADLFPLVSQHQGFVCLPRLFGECLIGRRKRMPQALTCWAGRKCNSARWGMAGRNGHADHPKVFVWRAFILQVTPLPLRRIDTSSIVILTLRIPLHNFYREYPGKAAHFTRLIRMVPFHIRHPFWCKSRMDSDTLLLSSF